METSVIQIYKILYFLASVSRPFSQRRSDRFLKSARKRHAKKTFYRDIAEMVSNWDSFKEIPVAQLVPDRIGSRSYQEWIESCAAAGRAKTHHREKIDSARPKISIIMPVCHSNVFWLKEAIHSVQAQTYTNWELCVANGCANNDAIRQILQRYASQDSRIKLVSGAADGHMSVVSNSAIEIAEGQWMGLLCQDDLLPANALDEVAAEIGRNPDAAIIYSDEDKINEAGKRYDPCFKSDWNPELFRAQNFISHLGIYRMDLVRELGGFRKGFEGSQDYDLALRVSDRAAKGQIRHIPKILYHWRSHGGRTAQSMDNKLYAADTAAIALEDHLNRIGISGHVEILQEGMFRVHYDLPADPPLVSIVIPTRNAEGLVRQCIDSIFEKTDYPNYEILLVDNNSDEEPALRYFSELDQNPRVTVLRDDRPFNYSAINNRAVSQANGEFVVLMNNDIEVITPAWLSEMMGHALQKDVGAVGARLWYPDGRLQHGGVLLGIGGVAGHFHKFLYNGQRGYFSRAELPQVLSAVTAACLLIRKSIFMEVGGLDEINLKVAFNDVDFCIRVREAGYHNIWTPYAELYHHESATRGPDDAPEKRARFQREILFMKERWGELLASDPFYNPNLSLDREVVELAFPPRT